MYPATASVVRYLIGCPSRTLLRSIVEENADLGHVEEPGPLGALQLAQRPFDRLRSGARPLRNRQRRQRQNPLGIAPLRQPRGDIRANDQVQLTVWF